jgi:hypothetical protein
MTFSDIQHTPFGVAAHGWLESKENSFRELLQNPIKDQEVSVAHTGLSFSVLLDEMLRPTNRNIAAGDNIVQPPRGLTGIVTRHANRAFEQSVVAFHASEGGRSLRKEAITGNESQASLEITFRTRGLDPALTHFDELMLGFSKWSITRSKRLELETVLRDTYKSADALRVSRAETIRLDRERRAAEAESQRQAELLRIQSNRVVHTGQETRLIPTQINRQVQTSSKTIWSGRKTVFYRVEELNKVEVRTVETKGDGSKTEADWVSGGEEWRDTGRTRKNKSFSWL